MNDSKNSTKNCSCPILEDFFYYATCDANNKNELFWGNSLKGKTEGSPLHFINYQMICDSESLYPPSSFSYFQYRFFCCHGFRIKCYFFMVTTCGESLRKQKTLTDGLLIDQWWTQKKWIVHPINRPNWPSGHLGSYF